MDRSKSRERRLHEQHTNKPHEMGLQVSCCVDTEMPPEAVVWATSETSWLMFHELARQKESKILEGDLHAEDIHMLISIPPKYSVSQVVYSFALQHLKPALNSQARVPGRTWVSELAKFKV